MNKRLTAVGIALLLAALGGAIWMLGRPGQHAGHAPEPQSRQVPAESATTSTSQPVVAPESLRVAGATQPAAQTAEAPARAQPASEVLDQDTKGTAQSGEPLDGNHSCGVMFRVGKSGRLSRVVIYALGKNPGAKLRVEIRPTRGKWPVESASMSLSSADVELPTLPRPIGYPPVSVRIDPPLQVRAGDTLAMVFSVAAGITADLGTGDDVNYDADLKMYSRRPNAAWVSPTTTYRRMPYQTYVIPDADQPAVPAPDGPKELVIKTEKGLVAEPDRYARKMIAMTDSAWQVLPRDVQDVTVGPDDRVWITFENRLKPVDEAAVKRVVEREFAQPAPQIHDLRPVLFEPQGRVWFTESSSRRGRVLYGYDGKEWLLHAVESPGAFLGAAPGHGMERGRVRNLFVEGTAFFPTSGAVQCFNGVTWTEQRFWPADAVFDAPKLELTPDGKSILVATPWNLYRLWRWTKGAWSPVGLPAELGSKLIYSVVPTDSNTAWVDTGDDRIRRITLGSAPAKPGVDVLSLMQRTKGPDAAQAAQQISALGGTMRIVCENALTTRSPLNDPNPATYGNPAVLREIINAMKRERRTSLSVIGPYVAQSVDVLQSVVPGIAITSADKVWERVGSGTGGKPPESTDERFEARNATCGMFLLGPGQKVTFVKGADAMGHGLTNTWSGAIPIAGKNEVWIGGTQIAGATTARMDLATGKILEKIKEQSHRFLFGRTSDGTLFLGPTPNSGYPICIYRPSGRGADNVAAESPGKKEPQKNTQRKNSPVVTAGHAPLERTPGAVLDAQGRAWIYTRSDGAQWYDGNNWHNVPGSILAGDLPCHLVPGTNGVLLMRQTFKSSSSPVRSESAWASPAGVLRAETWQDLLAENHALLAKEFGPASYGLKRKVFVFYVVGDKVGNLWVAGPGPDLISVYGNGQWYQEARPKSGKPQGVWGLGDGERVLVNEQNNSMMLQWASLKNGVIERESTGEVVAGGRLDQLVMDRENRVWTYRSANITMAGSYGKIGKLIGAKGVKDEIPGGRVMMVDPSGSAWVRNDQGTGSLEVWRDGRATTRMAAPAGYHVVVCSDRAGVAYVLTQAAATRYVETKPGVYEEESAYLPLPEFSDLQCSKLGFLIGEYGVQPLPGNAAK